MLLTKELLEIWKIVYETTGGQILAGAGPDIPLWLPEPDIITGE